MRVVSARAGAAVCERVASRVQLETLGARTRGVHEKSVAKLDTLRIRHSYCEESVSHASSSAHVTSSVNGRALAGSRTGRTRAMVCACTCMLLYNLEVFGE